MSTTPTAARIVVLGPGEKFTTASGRTYTGPCTLQLSQGGAATVQPTANAAMTSMFVVNPATASDGKRP